MGFVLELGRSRDPAGGLDDRGRGRARRESVPHGMKPTALGILLGMQGGPLDHVALWTDERDALANFLCERAGMHVIDRTDTFTLVGADAKKGKLTLFDADGPREPGALGRVGLRVHDESLAGDVSAPG